MDDLNAIIFAYIPQPAGEKIIPAITGIISQVDALDQMTTCFARHPFQAAIGITEE